MLRAWSVRDTNLAELRHLGRCQRSRQDDRGPRMEDRRLADRMGVIFSGGPNLMTVRVTVRAWRVCLNAAAIRVAAFCLSNNVRVE
eukprot:1593411-Rhodomonas_salina.4